MQGSINKWHKTLFTLGLGLVPFVIVSIFHGFTRHYAIHSDADIIYVYEALRINSGIPQHYLDHTGYVLFVLLAWWFNFLELIGVISVSALDKLPDNNSLDFEQIYAELVFAARYLSVILSGIFVSLFFRFMLLIGNNIRLAIISSLLFGLSAELIGSSLVVSTELPSALFTFGGFFALLKAREQERPRLYIFLGTFLIMLGLLAKMQIIILVLGFPFIILFFGRTIPSSISSSKKQWLLSIGLFLIALAPISAAATLAIVGIFENGVSIGFDPTICLGSKQKNGLYQGIIMLYVFVSVYIYGRIYQVNRRLIFDSSILVLAGISTGLLTTLLYFNPGNVVNLVNVIDHLYCLGSVFINAQEAQNNDILPWLKLLDMLSNGILHTLERRFLLVSHFSTIVGLLTWLFPLILMLLWKSANRIIFWRVLLLSSLSLGMEIVSSATYKIEAKHLIYLEPWFIAAFCLGFHSILMNIPSAIRNRIPILIIVIFMAETAASSQEKLQMRQPLENACGNAQGYMKEISPAFAHFCSK